MLCKLSTFDCYHWTFGCAAVTYFSVLIVVAAKFPRLFRYFQQAKQKADDKGKRVAIVQKVANHCQEGVVQGAKEKRETGKRGSRGNKRKELYDLLLEKIDSLVVVASGVAGKEVEKEARGLDWGELGEEDGIAEEQIEDFCLGIKEQVSCPLQHWFPSHVYTCECHQCSC